jgi:ornithine carbamoyltransferase
VRGVIFFERFVMRHILDLFELSATDIDHIFAITEDLKSKCEAGLREPLLAGRVMALLFEKPSLRTRVSFETAMAHLGGSTLFLGEDVGWGKRESTADFARVLGEYVDVIVCRAKCHQRVVELAQYAGCAVVNGLTDEAHPCQALGDVYTLREIHGRLRGLKLAYVGDANNVAASLLVASAKLGIEFAIASPAGYEFDPPFVAKVRAAVPDAKFELLTDPRLAVRGAHAIYTDVWTSMGQEAERAEREKVLRPYQVNAALLKHAPAEARFMHCLPARRGEEVTDDVIDGPSSAVLPQAANRLHAQKGLLAWLLAARL